MNRVLTDLIRSKVEPDAIDAIAARNLVIMIRDALPADAGLDDIDRAVAQAREGFSPLFRKPAPATPRGPTSALPQAIGAYAGRRLSDDEIANNRVRVGTAGGNPWAEGSISLTRQAMLQAADPDLAARLKREAGK